MPASLSPAQVAQYQRDGFLFPVDCLTPDEVRYFRGRLEDFEREQGDTFGKLPNLVRSKSHMLFTWMDALVRHPKVLDAVESMLGPDILIYHLTSWLKEPNDPAHVSWHQDGTYFGLEPAEQITAWIALTDATPEMGCIKLLPGSHVIGQRPHKDTFSPGNLLSRGQTIDHPRLDYTKYVMMPLKAGQVSLHHTHIVHCFRTEPVEPAPHRHRRQLHSAALPADQRRARQRRPGAWPRRLRSFRSGTAAGRRLRRRLARCACRCGGAILRVQQTAGGTSEIGQYRDLIRPPGGSDRPTLHATMEAGGSPNPLPQREGEC